MLRLCSVILIVYMRRLLQRFQNMKKELELKQNQELSKLKVMSAKSKGTTANINASRSNISGNITPTERRSGII